MIRAAARFARVLFPSVLAAVLVSCGREPTSPAGIEAIAFAGGQASVVLPTVRISEFHYDNDGTDAGEKIEVSFPTGMSLMG